MKGLPSDAQGRLALCDLFEELGADAPTLLGVWSTQDLAAHLVLRERDLIAGPCIVLPGLFGRFAERRRARLAEQREFESKPPYTNQTQPTAEPSLDLDAAHSQAALDRAGNGNLTVLTGDGTAGRPAVLRRVIATLGVLEVARPWVARSETPPDQATRKDPKGCLADVRHPFRGCPRGIRSSPPTRHHRLTQERPRRRGWDARLVIHHPNAE